MRSWIEAADRLAEWASRWMVVRTDCYGRYGPTGKTWCEKKTLDHPTLANHFRGIVTIGLYTTGGAGGGCRWCAWDFDNHDGAEGVAEKNLAGALEVCARLKAAGGGLTGFIEDSDGRGGLHVWCLFDGPVESQRAYGFARTIGDGLECECFPKQPVVAVGGMGNFIRLPGKHHKRDHWSRFYVNGEWWDGQDAVEFLLDRVGADPSGLPPCAAFGADGVFTERGSGGKAGEGTDALADPDDFNTAVSCLRRLGPKYRDEYDLWVKVGMILYRVDSGPDMLAVWDRWSKASPKYQPGACADKWRSFTPDRAGEPGKVGGPLTLGTLIHWAGGDISDRALDRLAAADVAAGGGGTPEAIANTPAADRALEAISDALGVKLDKFIQRGEEHGTECYYMVIEGREVKIGPACKLFNYQAVNGAVFATVQRKIKLKSKKWGEMIGHLGRVCVVEPIEEETAVGRLEVILSAYIESNSCASDNDWAEAAELGRPFVKGGMVHVVVQEIVQWARMNRIDFKEPYKLFKSCGWSPIQLRYAKETKRRFWCTAVDSASVPEILRSHA